MKKLNYIDVKTGEYVTLNCELSEDSMEAMNTLFQSVYQAKLDRQFHDHSLFAREYDTRNFVGALKEVLTQEVVDFSRVLECSARDSKLCNLRGEEMIAPQVVRVLEEFLYLFDYTEEARKSPGEYTEEMYYTKVQGVFGSREARFATELTNAYTNNTKLFTMIDFEPSTLLEKSEEKTSSLTYQKVVPFVPVITRNVAKA